MTTDAEKWEEERRRRHLRHLEITRELKATLPHQARIAAYRPGHPWHVPATLIEIDYDALADLVEKAMLNKSRKSKAGAFSVKVIL